MRLTVEFVGESWRVERPPFAIGREGDLVVDADNPFLHRRFLELHEAGTFWVLANVGTSLSATVVSEGGLQAWLAPGASLPLVVPTTTVFFTAGPTTYDLVLLLDEAPFDVVTPRVDADGDVTIGRVTLTPAQRLAIVALAEPALRRGDRTPSAIPTSAAAAARLAWPLTRFNRKLDNVCERLAAQGVRGLHGDAGSLASNRKARLVEYALSTGLVGSDDLPLLDAAADVAGEA